MLIIGCTSAISTRQVEPGLVATTSQEARWLHAKVDGYAYALPTGRLKVTATKSPGKSPTIGIEASLVGDPKYQLTASPRASGLADDDVTFETDSATGLLKAVTGNYKDQTTAIVESIVDTGVKAFQLSHGILPGAGVERSFRVEETVVDDEHYAFSVSFDPFDRKDLARAQAIFARKKLHLDFFGRLGNQFRGYDIPKDNRRLYYRSLLPYQVQVTDQSSFAYTSVNVLLPDESPIFSVDLKRAFLVNKVNELVFDHGTLTKVHTSKPSEILAFFKMLGNIVDKVAALSPIQIKIDQSKAREALMTQQSAELKSLGAKFDSQTSTATSQAAYVAKQRELELQAETDKRNQERSRTTEVERSVDERNKELAMKQEQIQRVSEERRKAQDENAALQKSIEDLQNKLKELEAKGTTPENK